MPIPNNNQGGGFSSIPWWGWVAGIGVIVVLFLVMRSGGSGGQVSPGASSDNTQQLSDLESGLQQLLAQSGSSSSGGLGGGSAGDGLTSGTSQPVNTSTPDNSPAPATPYSPVTNQTDTASPNPQPASTPAVNSAIYFGPSTPSQWGNSPTTQQSNQPFNPVSTNPLASAAAIAGYWGGFVQPAPTTVVLNADNPNAPTIVTQNGQVVSVSGSNAVGSSGQSSVVKPKGSKSVTNKPKPKPLGQSASNPAIQGNPSFGYQGPVTQPVTYGQSINNPAIQGNPSFGYQSPTVSSAPSTNTSYTQIIAGPHPIPV